VVIGLPGKAGFPDCIYSQMGKPVFLFPKHLPEMMVLAFIQPRGLVRGPEQDQPFFPGFFLLPHHFKDLHVMPAEDEV
jgi:hypothetical protein